MKRKIPPELKQLVVTRAKERCEYCLLPQAGFLIQFHVDHIRSVKHGGETVLDNLAFSSSYCNYFKGSDVATYLDENETLVRFFNPRTDSWADHFETFEGAIYSKTAVGEATVRIFQFNLPDRLILRRELARDGRYP